MNINASTMQIRDISQDNFKAQSSAGGQMMLEPSAQDSMSSSRPDQITQTKQMIAELKKQIGDKSESGEAKEQNKAESFLDKITRTIKEHPILSTAATAGTGFFTGIVTDSLLEKGKTKINPMDICYSDGINTPMEVAHLPFADPEISQYVLARVTGYNNCDFRCQAELTSKEDHNFHELIDYTVKKNTDDSVTIQGKYAQTEFKEQYSPLGPFSGKLDHFEKNKDTGEFVKTGEAKFTNVEDGSFGELSGNISGIDIYEKHNKSFRTDTYTGHIGECELNYKDKYHFFSGSKINGNVGESKVSGRYNNIHSEKDIGDFNMKLLMTASESKYSPEPQESTSRVPEREDDSCWAREQEEDGCWARQQRAHRKSEIRFKC